MSSYDEMNDNEKQEFRDWIRGVLKTEVATIKFTKKDNLGIEFPAEENAGLGFNKNRLTKIIKFLSDKMVDTYYHEITSFKY